MLLFTYCCFDGSVTFDSKKQLQNIVIKDSSNGDNTLRLTDDVFVGRREELVCVKVHVWARSRMVCGRTLWYMFCCRSEVCVCLCVTLGKQTQD